MCSQMFDFDWFKSKVENVYWEEYYSADYVSIAY